MYFAASTSPDAAIFFLLPRMQGMPAFWAARLARNSERQATCGGVLAQ